MPVAVRVAALVAIVFGLLTIVSGGSVALGLGGARAAAGAYVPFVVWFNALAGFAYVAAGAGLWLGRRWAAPLAVAIAAATSLVLVAFLLHLRAGGAFEMRTLLALALRLVVWIAIAAVALRARPPVPAQG